VLPSDRTDSALSLSIAATGSTVQQLDARDIARPRTRRNSSCQAEAHMSRHGRATRAVLYRPGREALACARSAVCTV
jgi:hypothetical protein